MSKRGKTVCLSPSFFVFLRASHAAEHCLSTGAFPFIYRHFRALGILAALVLLTACSQKSPPPTSRDVTLVTEDEYHIAATLYPVSADHPPGLILVHGYGGNRHDWTAFAKRGQRAGYMSIAIDLRGHGASAHQAGKSIDYHEFTKKDWMDTLHDIDAARKELIKEGADPDNLAAVGASLGANLVLHYALHHDDIQAVVMVSPGLDYHGIQTEKAIQAYGKRPVMFVYATGDTYAASSAQRLKALATGYAELREYQGAARGTDIFDRSLNANEQIFTWLKPIIGPNRGGDKP